jgi:hypothetical protein
VEHDEDELLLVITPHITTQADHNASTEVWLPH